MVQKEKGWICCTNRVNNFLMGQTGFLANMAYTVVGPKRKSSYNSIHQGKITFHDLENNIISRRESLFLLKT